MSIYYPLRINIKAYMTYVMSDLHGHYRKYLKMLDRIGFNDDDDLYILGDVVDWGPQPMELLCDMSMRMNVFPVIGNHDLTAALLLKKLNTEITEDNYANHLPPRIARHTRDVADGRREIHA